ncbi:MAG: glycosyltransferase family 4 protein [bacterium]
MKVAIITPHFFNPSGIGMMCNNLSSELVKKGNMVEVFTFVIPEQYSSNRVNSNVKVHAIRNMYAKSLNLSRKRYKIKAINSILNKYYRLLTLINIFKVMIARLHKLNIIHIHGYTDLTIVGFVVGKILRKPIILHFHGTDVWYYKKSFFNLYKRIVHNVDKVICISTCLADKLLNDTGIKSKVISYMVSDFFILQRGKRSNFLKKKFNADKILLNVKGMIPIYGHELLIKSLPEVIKKYPKLKLVLTGEGPLFETLERLVTTLRLENNVVFTGVVAHKALVDFYASSDIFILSSTLESRANVVLESLVCGTPVITTNNPAGIELADQYPGDVTLIEKDTPVALENAIIKMLEEGKRVKESTVIEISEQLNKEVIARKFMNIYNEIGKQDRKKIC